MKLEETDIKIITPNYIYNLITVAARLKYKFKSNNPRTVKKYVKKYIKNTIEDYVRQSKGVESINQSVKEKIESRND